MSTPAICGTHSSHAGVVARRAFRCIQMVDVKGERSPQIRDSMAAV
jgi:hypothetical protein